VKLDSESARSGDFVGIPLSLRTTPRNLTEDESTDDGFVRRSSTVTNSSSVSTQRRDSEYSTYTLGDEEAKSCSSTCSTPSISRLNPADGPSHRRSPSLEILGAKKESQRGSFIEKRRAMLQARRMSAEQNTGLIKLQSMDVRNPHRRKTHQGLKTPYESNIGKVLEIEARDTAETLVDRDETTGSQNSEKSDESGRDSPELKKEVHPFLFGMININTNRTEINNTVEKSTKKSYVYFLANYPSYYEDKNVSILLEKLKMRDRTRSIAPVHVVGLSSATVVLDLHEMQSNDPELQLSSATCAYYFYFRSDKIKNGDTRFKVSPPIREKQNQKLLFESLKIGVIDIVGSGHFPVHQELKFLQDESFPRAFSGISSLGFTLQACWTALYKRSKKAERKISRNMKRLHNWLCKKPAEMLNINDTKGTLSVGKHADIVIWRPFVKQVVRLDQVYSRYRNLNVFPNERLYGQIRATFLRGRKVYDHETCFKGSSPNGRVIYNKRVSKLMEEGHIA